MIEELLLTTPTGLSLLSLADMPDGHPVHEFDTYWKALRQDTEVPVRGEFDPMRVPRTLPWLIILAREGSEKKPRYRYRLAGEEISALLDTYPVGRMLDEIVSPEFLPECVQLYESVLTACSPVFYRRRVPVRDRAFLEVHSGLFPFRGKTGSEVFLIAAP